MRGVGRRREAACRELGLQSGEDHRVRESLPLQRQVAPADERLGLLDQERQDLVDHPTSLLRLQPRCPGQVLHELVQIVQLGVVHGDL